jgi:septal ring factor EnvC (AmiA/AmiB activator)
MARCDLLPRRSPAGATRLTHEFLEEPFSMAKTPKPHQAAAGDAATPDPRDAVIARLERELAEERQNSAGLRASLEQLRFKSEILEKSSTKQLADAKAKSRLGDRRVEELQQRLEAAETGRAEDQRLLAETRAALEQARIDRERRQIGRGAHARAADEAPASIDDLLSNTSAFRIRRKALEDAQVRAQLEAPLEEMIPPNLVFTVDDAEDDESR